jgi:BirA family transcriptional regulator, biotin operon repressor / biotin---[acetyl-CoA-carboxylase] ligase
VGDDYRYDGWSAGELAGELGVPAVSLHDTVGSTLDVAHDLAGGGAPAGTLVLADRQTAGRGQQGRRWTSHPGVGIWLTLIERPNDPAAVEVLSLRLGLRAAAALDRFAEQTVALKWPNDLYLGERKLAGTLVEARWRDGRPEWVAVGLGINVVPPAEVPSAAGLAAATRRIEVLADVVPALRGAAAAHGALSEREVAIYAARDLARGRACTSPTAGTVAGITADGELLVDTPDGRVGFRAGSLVLDRRTAD